MHLRDWCWKPHSHLLWVSTHCLGAISGGHYCNATVNICLNLTTYLWGTDLFPHGNLGWGNWEKWFWWLRLGQQGEWEIWEKTRTRRQADPQGQGKPWQSFHLGSPHQESNSSPGGQGTWVQIADLKLSFLGLRQSSGQLQELYGSCKVRVRKWPVWGAG